MKSQYSISSCRVSYPYFFANFNAYNFNLCVFLLINLVQSKVRIKRFIILEYLD